MHLTLVMTNSPNPKGLASNSSHIAVETLKCTSVWSLEIIPAMHSVSAWRAFHSSTTQWYRPSGTCWLVMCKSCLVSSSWEMGYLMPELLKIRNMWRLPLDCCKARAGSQQRLVTIDSIDAVIAAIIMELGVMNIHAVWAADKKAS